MSIYDDGIEAVTPSAPSTGRVLSYAKSDGLYYQDATGTEYKISTGATPAGGLQFTVRNITGATIAKGSAVYITGASGQTPTIALAQAHTEVTSTSTIGITQAAISNNSTGLVTIAGAVTGLATTLDASGAVIADGAALWLSATVAGGLAIARPSAPNHATFIGIVSYAHATNGVIQLNVQNGYEMEELHNVSSVAATNGQVLAKNTTSTLWEPVTITPTLIGAASAGNVPVDTHAAPSKATPADLDEFPLADSATTFSLKKLTWGNLVASIKTALTGWAASFASINNTPIGATTRAAVNGTIGDFSSGISVSAYASNRFATGNKTGYMSNFYNASTGDDTLSFGLNYDDYTAVSGTGWGTACIRIISRSGVPSSMTTMVGIGATPSGITTVSSIGFAVTGQISSTSRALINGATDNGVDALQVNGSLITSQLKTTQTATASTTASTHSIPVVIGGVTYYMRLSSTP